MEARRSILLCTLILASSCAAVSVGVGALSSQCKSLTATADTSLLQFLSTVDPNTALGRVCSRLEGCVSAAKSQSMRFATARAKLNKAGNETKPCPNSCSGNGICDAGKCMCQPGLSGDDCSVDMCEHLSRCNGHGRCRQTKCFCDAGFTGDKCDTIVPCNRNCSSNGVCKHGKCFCDPGFEGPECQKRSRCANDCSRHGVCVNGACVCSPGWGDADCSLLQSVKPCPNSGCGGKARGECRGGKCFCLPGFTGDGCQTKRRCVGDCNGHGRCQFGARCLCEPGWAGEGCATAQTCPNDCNANGVCKYGKCFCHPGWGGPQCSTKAACMNDCSGQGLCVGGTCVCESGYKGDDCSVGVALHPASPSLHTTQNGCPSGCSGHGVCAYGTSFTLGNPKGECLCEPGYTGTDCATMTVCPGGAGDGTMAGAAGAAGFGKGGNSCSGHGVCVGGKCRCLWGFSGPGCETITNPLVLAGCPSNCTGNGRCLSGKCYCDPGFSGAACAKPTPCPGNCTGQGQCVAGTCLCQPGFMGAACETLSSCPSDCSNHGVCVSGACQCEYGYTGAACSYAPSCAAHPCQHGLCRGGKCMCDDGFTGIACGIPTDSVAVQTGGGRAQCLTPCVHGTCALIKTRVKGGTDKGQHLAFACACQQGWTGVGCNKPALSLAYRCTATSCAHGRCSSSGACICDAGYSGASCDVSSTASRGPTASDPNSPPAAATGSGSGSSGSSGSATGAPSGNTPAANTPAGSTDLAKEAAKSPPATSCVKMTAAEKQTWEAYKSDRTAATTQALTPTKADGVALQKAAGLALLELQSSVAPAVAPVVEAKQAQAGEAAEVHDCPSECTSELGSCVQGECVCHRGVSRHFCMAGVVLTAELRPQTLVHGTAAASVAGASVPALRSRWTAAAVLAAAVAAFTLGLASGLFAMWMARRRTRQLAEAIMSQPLNG